MKNFLNFKLINKRFFHSLNQKQTKLKRFSLMQPFLFTNKEDCKAKLKEFNISFLAHSHEAVFNMVEMQKVKLEKAPHIKNLFYADKKDNFYLVLALHETKVEKSFWRSLNVAPGNVRLAKDEDLEKILNVKRGSVNPFALINDKDSKVKFIIIDQKLFDQHDFFAFHPMDNSETLELSKNDFVGFLEKIGRTYKVIALDEVVEEKPKEEKVKEESKKKAAAAALSEEKKDDGHTKLCLEFKKSENFPKWYSQVITKAELIEYYDVSGCYILRPWAYSMWEKIQEFFDKLIKEVCSYNIKYILFIILFL